VVIARAEDERDAAAADRADEGGGQKSGNGADDHFVCGLVRISSPRFADIVDESEPIIRIADVFFCIQRMAV